MSNKTRRIYLAAAIFALVVGYYVYASLNQGKNPFSGQRGRNANIIKFDIPFERFAGAETIRRVRSTELAAEVQKVIEQNGLPADVFVDDTLIITNGNNKPAPNIAVTLHDLFHEYYDPNNPNDAMEKLWEASPVEVWDINEQTLGSVRETLVLLEPKRQTIRTMLEQDARFYYIFIYPESLKHGANTGVIVNTEASRYLSDYALLEEYAIAQALLKGNIDEAVSALAYIFRMAQLAAHIGNVGTRSDAALVRLRTFDVMQRVILDPHFDRARMVVLQKMLLEQYDHWTPEYVTWFGDRASGIAWYNRILMYGPEDALEEAALKELEKRSIAIDRTFSRGFMKYHEADEAFYLRSMQKVLDVSGKPFEKRLDILDQIYGELFKKEDTYDDQGIAMESFAANILLKDIDRLMRIFAKDKSALNRALVLMDASLGQDRTDRYRDPFTGEPYEIRRVDGLLTITTPTLPRPFRVPSFTEKE